MKHEMMIATMGAAMIAAPLLGAENKVWLDELDLSGMSCGWRKTQARKSVLGKPLTLGGKTFEHGAGTHAMSRFVLPLGRPSASTTR